MAIPLCWRQLTADKVKRKGKNSVSFAFWSSWVLPSGGWRCEGGHEASTMVCFAFPPRLEETLAARKKASWPCSPPAVRFRWTPTARKANTTPTSPCVALSGTETARKVRLEEESWEAWTCKKVEDPAAGSGATPVPVLVEC